MDQVLGMDAREGAEGIDLSGQPAAAPGSELDPGFLLASDLLESMRAFDDVPTREFDAERVFREAVETSTQVERREADLEAERRRALGEALRAAQAGLLEEVKKAVGERVPRAAAQGLRTTSVLDFLGSESFDGKFCYLYLVRGPRERAHREDLRALGVTPLLPRLRRELHPFVVRHNWEPSTNENTVTVSW